MAKGVTVKVDGIKELGVALKALDVELSTKIVRGAGNAGAQVIRKRAVDLAPQSDEPHKVNGQDVQPGNLKRNIYVARDTKNTETTGYLVRVRKSKKPGKDAFYAYFLEYGTVKMAAQPFMRPAFASAKEQAVSKIKEVLTKRIDSANRKLGLKK